MDIEKIRKKLKKELPEFATTKPKITTSRDYVYTEIIDYDVHAIIDDIIDKFGSDNQGCQKCGMNLQVALGYAKSFLRSKTFPNTNEYWSNLKKSIESGQCPGCDKTDCAKCGHSKKLHMDDKCMNFIEGDGYCLCQKFIGSDKTDNTNKEKL